MGGESANEYIRQVIKFLISNYPCTSCLFNQVLKSCKNTETELSLIAHGNLTMFGESIHMWKLLQLPIVDVAIYNFKTY